MPNRLICTVLDEMRDAYKTRNFSYIMGLIEEAQSLANRMESALGDEHRMEWKEEEYQDLKTDIRELKRKKKQLKKEIYELEEKKIDMGLEDVVGDSDDNLRDKVRQGEG